MFCAYDTKVIAAFEETISQIKALENLSNLSVLRPIRRRLKELGFATPLAFLLVLQSFKPRSLFGTDVSTLRAISRDSNLCRKLQGSHLSEVLLNLLSNETLRMIVTRHFLLEMNCHPDCTTEGVWLTAESLVAALDHGLIKVDCINSVRQYVELGKAAHDIINSERYTFPKPPFGLPDGWRWLSTGADFKALGNYSPEDCLHKVEMHHRSFLAGTCFIARDPNGKAWDLSRLPVA